MPPGLAERERQLAVHPDLGVVVDDDLEDDRRAGGVEIAGSLGDRHGDPVPVEAHAAVREPEHRLLGSERAPVGVVELEPFRVRDDGVRAIRDRARPEGVLRRAELDEVDLLDTAVRIPPLTAHEGGSLRCLQVDDRVRAPRKKLRGPGET